VQELFKNKVNENYITELSYQMYRLIQHTLLEFEERVNFNKFKYRLYLTYMDLEDKTCREKYINRQVLNQVCPTYRIYQNALIHSISVISDILENRIMQNTFNNEMIACCDLLFIKILGLSSSNMSKTIDYFIKNVSTDMKTFE
jgi:hypothetical protein